MPNSKLTVFDPETAAQLGLEDGRVYPLPACELPYGELEATDAASDAPATRQLDLDVRAAVGHEDDGEECLGHIPDALAAAFALRKAAPAPHPLRTFYGVPEAYDEAVIDLLRWFGVPHVTIDKFMGRPVDRTVRRLLPPCAEAKRLDALEIDTQRAIEADAKRAAVQSAFEKRLFEGVVPAGEFWMARPAMMMDPDGNQMPTPGDRPHYTDDDDMLWNRYELLPGMECHLRSKQDRPVLRSGDRLPFPNGVINSPKVHFTNAMYHYLRKATKAARKGQPMAPRLEPSLRHRDPGKALIAENIHRIKGSHGYALRYVTESCVRGLGIPVITFLADFEEILKKESGGVRPWNVLQPSDMAGFAIAILESTDGECMEWGALIPAGIVDKMADKIATWTEPLRRFFAGKERVSTPEIEQELGSTLSPVDHQAVYSIARDAGFQKRRVQVDGAREHFFVKQ